jgi:hypothetical protein
VRIVNDINKQPNAFANAPQRIYKWDNLMIIDVDDKLTNFYSYLFPTDQEWNQQVNNLVQRVVTESDRSKKISNLAVLPHQEYVRLSNNQLIDCISTLMEGNVTSDYVGCENHEMILYKLVASIKPEGQLAFIIKFENQLVQMVRKFQGVYKDSIVLKVSQYITNVKGLPNASQVFSYFMRSDGSCINRVFYWQESFGVDPLYLTSLSMYENSISMSVRNTMWFSGSTFLMNIAPTDFIGVVAKTPMPALGLNTDEMVIIPALKFHWLYEQRNREEAWKRFVQGVDVAFTIGTMGTYGAVKSFKQVGTTYAIGMAMDYSLRLAINSLYYDTMDEAIANTSLFDAAWNAANAFVINPKLAVVLPCVREFAKAYFVDDLGVGGSSIECGRTILFSVITNNAIASNGVYANKVKVILQQHPRKTVAKLRDIGVDKESMLALARLLFGSTTDQTYLNVVNYINDAY